MSLPRGRPWPREWENPPPGVIHGLQPPALRAPRGALGGLPA